MRSLFIKTFLVPFVSSFKTGRYIPVFPPKIQPIIRAPTEPLNQFSIFRPDYNESSQLKKDRINFMRESELKHSRLAMVSVIAFPILEHYTHTLGINSFQTLPDTLQLSIVGGMFISEFTSMLKGWANPFNSPFTLLDDYQPGDLGFGIWDRTDVSLMDKELNNGRLAMFGILGMMGQELVTHQTLF